MNYLIIVFFNVLLVNSFRPLFHRKSNIKLFEKKLDLFEKFEKFTHEKNEKMQEEYLFKIYEFLSIKRDFDNYQKSLLEEDIENQEKYISNIYRHINISNKKK